MGLIHVIGIGLEGATGLTAALRQIVQQSTLLVGSARHLSYFPEYLGDRIVLGDLTDAIAQIRQQAIPETPSPSHTSGIVVLTSGDPLFFGLGRLLLAELPAEQLVFHPHLSSVQLAFNRIKLPWQDAQIISVHGRSLDALIQVLKQAAEKIAILTDGTHTPSAIAHLLQSLDLPSRYRIWVCENLAGSEERILETQELADLQNQSFAPLNVVILQRIPAVIGSLDVKTLPLLGLPDSLFLSFPDRPGLMTKREIRVQILAELALQPTQIVWDIGAGTGSVAIEIARLCPGSTVYAIEKTAIGTALIEKNSQQFQVKTVIPIAGIAPDALEHLPSPDRIFIGGSGGNLTQILDTCTARLAKGGRIVLALATLEHLTLTLTWLRGQTAWSSRLLQVQVARSLPIANLTRFDPLNPVTLVVMESLNVP
jgi:precorrin-6Y C5,15-methyltransferase (decarboxylating)